MVEYFIGVAVISVIMNISMWKLDNPNSSNEYLKDKIIGVKNEKT